MGRAIPSSPAPAAASGGHGARGGAPAAKASRLSSIQVWKGHKVHFSIGGKGLQWYEVMRVARSASPRNYVEFVVRLACPSCLAVHTYRCTIHSCAHRILNVRKSSWLWLTDDTARLPGRSACRAPCGCARAVAVGRPAAADARR